jgi:transposase
MDQLKKMLRHRFGQKSERYIDSNNPQLSLIEGVTEETLSDVDAPEKSVPELPDNVVDINSKKQRKKAQQGFASHLPRTEVVIAVKEHDKTCQCGCQKAVINHQRHERLNYIPPVYEIIVELRELVACPKGCRGEIVTAEKPKHISASLTAMSDTVGHEKHV